MNIAIAGFGVEGAASYRYFARRGDKITILDEREDLGDIPQGATTVLGAHAFENLDTYDMVIRSPSLPPYKLAGAKKIWSATNEFLAQCQAPIIGVTGTKGKGTTCSLIAAILQKAGKKVHIVGNIGTPALDVFGAITADDVVVYELSSFQLWDAELSPHIAVVLMVEPDHLNVHANFDEYAVAKSNIAAHQRPNDVVIYHPTNEISAQIAERSPAMTKLRYQTSEAAHVENGMVIIDDITVCAVDEVGLLGAYNLQNVCAALSASWQLVPNAEAAGVAIRGFKGLEHRLEFVAKKRGVKFYNDSFSSAPTATMAAITAFTEPIVLVMGGYDKGVDLLPLAQRVAETKNIERVILIGQVRGRIAAMFMQLDFDRYTVSDSVNIDEIVAVAVSYAPQGGVVLLSPGCASFDMFKNFYERGTLFKQAVKELRE